MPGGRPEAPREADLPTECMPGDTGRRGRLFNRDGPFPCVSSASLPRHPVWQRGETEVQRALAQGTSRAVQPLLLRPRQVPQCFPVR